MAYDAALAERIEDLVAGEEGVARQRMFGGVAFLVHGHMAVAASGQGGLMARVDPAQAEQWVDGEHVTPMVMRGREMLGWLRVGPELGDEELETWVARGLAFARSLPPKAGR